VFNLIFSNISFTSWRSFLLVNETGLLKKNHRRPTENHLQTFPYMLYQIYPAMGVSDNRH
jgi:hypothetical protein